MNTLIFSTAANICRCRRAERLRNRASVLCGTWRTNGLSVIAPRLSSRVGFPPIGQAWKDTAIELPETFPRENVHDLFICRPICLHEREVKLEEALSVLPFAVITNL